MMENKVRDVVVLMAATTFAAFGALRLGEAIVLAANVLVKAVLPRHVVLSRVTWLYIVLTFVTLGGAAFLMGDLLILGWWTVPAIIALGFAYCVVHLMFGPRTGDDGRDAAG